MINSQYILDIFDLAFDNHSASVQLQQQISFLSIAKELHTGTGIFIYFQADTKIQQFKINTLGNANYDIAGNHTQMINGIEIKNRDLLILADAIIHLKNDIIDHLEIWNKCGEDYVKTQPDHYELQQVWLENSGRKIIR